MKCEKCGRTDCFEHLSDGAGAEMWRCGYCGAVYNRNPFGIDFVCEWKDYQANYMFPSPINAEARRVKV